MTRDELATTIRGMLPKIQTRESFIAGEDLPTVFNFDREREPGYALWTARMTLTDELMLEPRLPEFLIGRFVGLGCDFERLRRVVFYWVQEWDDVSLAVSFCWMKKKP